MLDLDETLIHSHHDAMPRNSVKPGTPHDFTVKVTIDRHPVRFFVHKRPHVDFFLSVVSCNAVVVLTLVRAGFNNFFFSFHFVDAGFSMVRRGRIYRKYGNLWCSCG